MNSEYKEQAATGQSGAEAGERHAMHVISGLGLGGAEMVLLRLVTAPGQSWRHTVVSMTDAGVVGPRLREAGVRLVTLDMPSGRLSLSGLWRLYRMLRAERPDVVQTWMYHADLVAGVVARLAGIRAVAWGIRNSGDQLESSSRVARTVAWLCAKVSGRVPATVIACAEDAAQRHLGWGYRADRMQVIPNGYDLTRWRPDAAARERLRAAWGCGPQTVLVGSVARWNPLKDHANLLEAFALCAGRHPELHCVLVGKGLSDDNPELMALIDRLQLRDRVRLLGRRDDVPDIMNALDIHVLSSCAEGFPNVVAEAMACGTTCVVTDVGDAARIVGPLGWVVPPRNPQALAQAMHDALAQYGTEPWLQRQEQGRARVQALYGLQGMVQAYGRAWEALAQAHPPRGGYRAVVRADAGGRRRLMYVVNNPAFFLSHRLPLALAAQEAGFEIHVATPDGPTAARVRELGLTHHIVPMSRSGKNPLQELRTLHALWRLYRQVQPDVVHAVTIKPVLYGGIAARLARVPGYIAAVSGLGFVFMRTGKRMDFLRWAAVLLYRLALGHPRSRVIFQNTSDRDVLLDAGVVRPEQVVLIRGSGVDLDEFSVRPEPPAPVVAVLAARLLGDKGVREFVEAARQSGRHSNLRWVLAGSLDAGNPASIKEQELAAWQQEGIIEYVGEQTDMAGLYQRSHIAVLPSYREGLPKSLIEAAACGRAVVTTDVPGCRDAIEPGVSGLLVPPRDAAALGQAVQRLAVDSRLRQQMGAAGRELAEHAFDIRQVVDKHLDLYRTL